MTYNNITIKLTLALLGCLSVGTACQRESLAEQSTANPAIAQRQLAEAMATTISTTCGGPATPHLISLAYAYQLVNNYRIASRIPGRICQLYNQGGWVLAETFPASAIQAILAQANTCSFRIYNGLDTDNRQHLVLVGADSLGRDVLFNNRPGGTRTDEETGLANNTPLLPIIVEMGLPCPQACTGVYVGP
jgi:hypothetical protein